MNGEFQSVRRVFIFNYSKSENSNFNPSPSFLLLRMEFSSFRKIGVSILVDPKITAFIPEQFLIPFKYEINFRI